VTPAGWRPAAWVVLCSGALLAIETGLLAWVGLRQNGVLGPPWPLSVDFLSFYAAGRLVLAGTPALVYDQAAHAAAELALSGNGGPYVFFLYPPVFLLPCALLALLPYPLAHAVFIAVTAGLFLATLRGAMGTCGRWWILPALAFPATAWTVFMGQNAFLNAALLGTALLLADRRPGMAGIALGALCYKPHIAMLAPIWLLATGRWRMLLAALLTVCGLVALTLPLLGPATWSGYLTAAAGADAVYTTGRINLADFPTVLAALLLLGAPLRWASAAQAASAIAMGVLVWIGARRAAGPAAKALLVAATLLAMPVLSFNDQILAVLAVAFLASETAIRPWRRGETALLALVFPAAIIAPVVADLTHVPLGLMIDVAILGLCARRCFMTMTGDRTRATA